jgi:hypothetical protein
MDNTLNKIIHKTSLDTFTDKEVVEKVISAYYKMYFEFVKTANREDPESFPRFMMPYIGSLKANTRKINRLNQKLGGQTEIGKD